eukprot:jgi/Mesvir1/3614/Mv13028-RA.1
MGLQFTDHRGWHLSFASNVFSSNEDEPQDYTGQPFNIEIRGKGGSARRRPTMASMGPMNHWVAETLLSTLENYFILDREKALVQLLSGRLELHNVGLQPDYFNAKFDCSIKLVRGSVAHVTCYIRPLEAEIIKCVWEGVELVCSTREPSDPWWRQRARRLRRESRKAMLAQLDPLGAALDAEELYERASISLESFKGRLLAWSVAALHAEFRSCTAWMELRRRYAPTGAAPSETSTSHGGQLQGEGGALGAGMGDADLPEVSTLELHMDYYCWHAGGRDAATAGEQGASPAPEGGEAGGEAGGSHLGAHAGAAGESGHDGGSGADLSTSASVAHGGDEVDNMTGLEGSGDGLERGGEADGAFWEAAGQSAAHAGAGSSRFKWRNGAEVQRLLLAARRAVRELMSLLYGGNVPGTMGASEFSNDDGTICKRATGLGLCIRLHHGQTLAAAMAAARKMRRQSRGHPRGASHREDHGPSHAPPPPSSSRRRRKAPPGSLLNAGSPHHGEAGDGSSPFSYASSPTPSHTFLSGTHGARPGAAHPSGALPPKVWPPSSSSSSAAYALSVPYRTVAFPMTFRNRFHYRCDGCTIERMSWDIDESEMDLSASDLAAFCMLYGNMRTPVGVVADDYRDAYLASSTSKHWGASTIKSLPEAGGTGGLGRTEGKPSAAASGPRDHARHPSGGGKGPMPAGLGNNDPDSAESQFGARIRGFLGAWKKGVSGGNASVGRDSKRGGGSGRGERGSVSGGDGGLYGDEFGGSPVFAARITEEENLHLRQLALVGLIGERAVQELLLRLSGADDSTDKGGGKDVGSDRVGAGVGGPKSTRNGHCGNEEGFMLGHGMVVRDVPMNGLGRPAGTTPGGATVGNGDWDVLALGFGWLDSSTPLLGVGGSLVSPSAPPVRAVAVGVKLCRKRWELLRVALLPSVRRSRSAMLAWLRSAVQRRHFAAVYVASIRAYLGKQRAKVAILAGGRSRPWDVQFASSWLDGNNMKVEGGLEGSSGRRLDPVWFNQFLLEEEDRLPVEAVALARRMARARLARLDPQCAAELVALSPVHSMTELLDEDFLAAARKYADRRPDSLSDWAVDKAVGAGVVVVGLVARVTKRVCLGVTTVLQRRQLVSREAARVESDNKATKEMKRSAAYKGSTSKEQSWQVDQNGGPGLWGLFRRRGSAGVRATDEPGEPSGADGSTGDADDDESCGTVHSVVVRGNSLDGSMWADDEPPSPGSVVVGEGEEGSESSAMGAGSVGDEDADLTDDASSIGSFAQGNQSHSRVHTSGGHARGVRRTGSFRSRLRSSRHSPGGGGMSINALGYGTEDRNWPAWLGCLPPSYWWAQAMRSFLRTRMGVQLLGQQASTQDGNGGNPSGPMAGSAAADVFKPGKVAAAAIQVDPSLYFCFCISRVRAAVHGDVKVSGGGGLEGGRGRGAGGGDLAWAPPFVPPLPSLLYDIRSLVCGYNSGPGFTLYHFEVGALGLHHAILHHARPTGGSSLKGLRMGGGDAGASTGLPVRTGIRTLRPWAYLQDGECFVKTSPAPLLPGSGWGSWFRGAHDAGAVAGQGSVADHPRSLRRWWGLRSRLRDILTAASSRSSSVSMQGGPPGSPDGVAHAGDSMPPASSGARSPPFFTLRWVMLTGSDVSRSAHVHELETRTGVWAGRAHVVLHPLLIRNLLAVTAASFPGGHKSEQGAARSGGWADNRPGSALGQLGRQGSGMGYAYGGDSPSPPPFSAMGDEGVPSALSSVLDPVTNALAAFLRGWAPVEKNVARICVDAPRISLCGNRAAAQAVVAGNDGGGSLYTLEDDREGDGAVRTGRRSEEMEPGQHGRAGMAGDRLDRWPWEAGPWSWSEPGELVDEDASSNLSHSVVVVDMGRWVAASRPVLDSTCRAEGERYAREVVELDEWLSVAAAGQLGRSISWDGGEQPMSSIPQPPPQHAFMSAGGAAGMPPGSAPAGPRHRRPSGGQGPPSPDAFSLEASLRRGSSVRGSSSGSSYSSDSEDPFGEPSGVAGGDKDLPVLEEAMQRMFSAVEHERATCGAVGMASCSVRRGAREPCAEDWMCNLLAVRCRGASVAVCPGADVEPSLASPSPYVGPRRPSSAHRDVRMPFSRRGVVGTPPAPPCSPGHEELGAEQRGEGKVGWGKETASHEREFADIVANAGQRARQASAALGGKGGLGGGDSRPSGPFRDGGGAADKEWAARGSRLGGVRSRRSSSSSIDKMADVREELFVVLRPMMVDAEVAEVYCGDWKRVAMGQRDVSWVMSLASDLSVGSLHVQLPRHELTAAVQVLYLFMDALCTPFGALEVDALCLPPAAVSQQPSRNLAGTATGPAQQRGGSVGVPMAGGRNARKRPSLLSDTALYASAYDVPVPAYDDEGRAQRVLNMERQQARQTLGIQQGLSGAHPRGTARLDGLPDGPSLGRQGDALATIVVPPPAFAGCLLTFFMHARVGVQAIHLAFQDEDAEVSLHGAVFPKQDVKKDLRSLPPAAASRGGRRPSISRSHSEIIVRGGGAGTSPKGTAAIIGGSNWPSPVRSAVPGADEDSHGRLPMVAPPLSALLYPSRTNTATANPSGLVRHPAAPKMSISTDDGKGMDRRVHVHLKGLSGEFALLGQSLPVAMSGRQAAQDSFSRTGSFSNLDLAGLLAGKGHKGGGNSRQAGRSLRPMEYFAVHQAGMQALDGGDGVPGSGTTANAGVTIIIRAIEISAGGREGANPSPALPVIPPSSPQTRVSLRPTNLAGGWASGAGNAAGPSWLAPESATAKPPLAMDDSVPPTLITLGPFWVCVARGGRDPCTAVPPGLQANPLEEDEYAITDPDAGSWPDGAGGTHSPRAPPSGHTIRGSGGDNRSAHGGDAFGDTNRGSGVAQGDLPWDAPQAFVPGEPPADWEDGNGARGDAAGFDSMPGSSTGRDWVRRHPSQEEQWSPFRRTSRAGVRESRRSVDHDEGHVFPLMPVEDGGGEEGGALLSGHDWVLSALAGRMCVTCSRIKGSILTPEAHVASEDMTLSLAFDEQLRDMELLTTGGLAVLDTSAVASIQDLVMSFKPISRRPLPLTFFIREWNPTLPLFPINGSMISLPGSPGIFSMPPSGGQRPAAAGPAPSTTQTPTAGLISSAEPKRVPPINAQPLLPRARPYARSGLGPRTSSSLKPSHSHGDLCVLDAPQPPFAAGPSTGPLANGEIGPAGDGDQPADWGGTQYTLASKHAMRPGGMAAPAAGEVGPLSRPPRALRRSLDGGYSTGQRARGAASTWDAEPAVAGATQPTPAVAGEGEWRGQRAGKLVPQSQVDDPLAAPLLTPALPRIKTRLQPELSSVHGGDLLGNGELQGQELGHGSEQGGLRITPPDVSSLMPEDGGSGPQSPAYTLPALHKMPSNSSSDHADSAGGLNSSFYSPHGEERTVRDLSPSDDSSQFALDTSQVPAEHPQPALWGPGRDREELAAPSRDKGPAQGSRPAEAVAGPGDAGAAPSQGSGDGADGSMPRRLSVSVRRRLSASNSSNWRALLGNFWNTGDKGTGASTGAGTGVGGVQLLNLAGSFKSLSLAIITTGLEGEERAKGMLSETSLAANILLGHSSPDSCEIVLEISECTLRDLKETAGTSLPGDAGAPAVPAVPLARTRTPPPSDWAALAAGLGAASHRGGGAPNLGGWGAGPAPFTRLMTSPRGWIGKLGTAVLPGSAAGGEGQDWGASSAGGPTWQVGGWAGPVHTHPAGVRHGHRRSLSFGQMNTLGDAAGCIMKHFRARCSLLHLGTSVNSWGNPGWGGQVSVSGIDLAITTRELEVLSDLVVPLAKVQVPSMVAEESSTHRAALSMDAGWGRDAAGNASRQPSPFGTASSTPSHLHAPYPHPELPPEIVRVANRDASAPLHSQGDARRPSRGSKEDPSVLPNGAYVTIKDTREQWYLYVVPDASAPRGYSLRGARHYAIAGVDAVFQVHWAPRSKGEWFSLASVRAVDRESGQPLRLHFRPGSHMLHIESTNERAWELWKRVPVASTMAAAKAVEPERGVAANGSKGGAAAVPENAGGAGGRGHMVYQLVNQKSGWAIAFDGDVPVLKPLVKGLPTPGCKIKILRVPSDGNAVTPEGSSPGTSRVDGASRTKEAQSPGAGATGWRWGEGLLGSVNIRRLRQSRPSLTGTRRPLFGAARRMPSVLSRESLNGGFFPPGGAVTAELTAGGREFGLPEHPKVQFELKHAVVTVLYESRSGVHVLPLLRWRVKEISAVGLTTPTKFHAFGMYTTAVESYQGQGSFSCWDPLVENCSVSLNLRWFFVPKPQEPGADRAPPPLRIQAEVQKKVKVRIGELALDTCLFLVNTLELGGPYAIKNDPTRVNRCLVLNKTAVSILCKFDHGVESHGGVVTPGGSETYLIRHVASRRDTRPALTSERVEIRFMLASGGWSAAVSANLATAGAQAHWVPESEARSSVSGADAKLPVVVDVSERGQEGLLLTIAPLLAIHNNSGLRLEMMFEPRMRASEASPDASAGPSSRREGRTAGELLSLLRGEAAGAQLLCTQLPDGTCTDCIKCDWWEPAAAIPLGSVDGLPLVRDIAGSVRASEGGHDMGRGGLGPTAGLGWASGRGLLPGASSSSHSARTSYSGEEMGSRGLLGGPGLPAQPLERLGSLHDTFSLAFRPVPAAEPSLPGLAGMTARGVARQAGLWSADLISTSGLDRTMSGLDPRSDGGGARKKKSGSSKGSSTRDASASTGLGSRLYTSALRAVHELWGAGDTRANSIMLSCYLDEGGEAEGGHAGDEVPLPVDITLDAASSKRRQWQRQNQQRAQGGGTDGGGASASAPAAVLPSSSAPAAGSAPQRRRPLHFMATLVARAVPCAPTSAHSGSRPVAGVGGAPTGGGSGLLFALPAASVATGLLSTSSTATAPATVATAQQVSITILPSIMLQSALPMDVQVILCERAPNSAAVRAEGGMTDRPPGGPDGSTSGDKPSGAFLQSEETLVNLAAGGRQCLYLHPAYVRLSVVLGECGCSAEMVLAPPDAWGGPKGGKKRAGDDASRWVLQGGVPGGGSTPPLQWREQPLKFPRGEELTVRVARSSEGVWMCQLAVLHALYNDAGLTITCQPGMEPRKGGRRKKKAEATSAAARAALAAAETAEMVAAARYSAANSNVKPTVVPPSAVLPWLYPTPLLVLKLPHPQACPIQVDMRSLGTATVFTLSAPMAGLRGQALERQHFQFGIKADVPPPPSEAAAPIHALRIVPRFLVYNNGREKICVAQHGFQDDAAAVVVIPPRQCKPIHWRAAESSGQRDAHGWGPGHEAGEESGHGNRGGGGGPGVDAGAGAGRADTAVVDGSSLGVDEDFPCLLCVRPEEGRWDWSGPVSVRALGTFCVKLRSSAFAMSEPGLPVPAPVIGSTRTAGEMSEVALGALAGGPSGLPRTVRYGGAGAGGGGLGPESKATSRSNSIGRGMYAGGGGGGSKREMGGSGFRFMQVEISEEEPSIAIGINNVTAASTPYRVENRLRHRTIFFHQKDVERYESLEPGCVAAYSWDSLDMPHRLCLYVSGSSIKQELSLDKVHPPRPFDRPHHRSVDGQGDESQAGTGRAGGRGKGRMGGIVRRATISLAELAAHHMGEQGRASMRMLNAGAHATERLMFAVRAQGPIRVLTVMEDAGDGDNVDNAQGGGHGGGGKMLLQGSPALHVMMDLQCRVSEVAVVFLENIKQKKVNPVGKGLEPTLQPGSSEVAIRQAPFLYLRVLGIALDFSNGDETAVDFSLARLDADVKWEGAPGVVFLRPEDGSVGTSKPLLLAGLVVSNFSRSSMHIRNASLLLQALTVNLDEDTLLKLMAFGRSSLATADRTGPSTPLYLESFEINPIKITGSFTPSRPDPNSGKTMMSFPSLSSSQEELRALIHSVIKLPSIRNAVLMLDGFQAQHLLVSRQRLAGKLRDYYSRALLFGLCQTAGAELLVPPAFAASLFEDTAASTILAYFDPSDAKGFGIGVFNHLRSNLWRSPTNASSQYLGHLRLMVQTAGSNMASHLMHGALTEVSDEMLRGVQSGGLDGLVRGFYRGLLNVSQRPGVWGMAILKGGPTETLKLDRSIGTDELYLEGYLQASLDAIFKSDYLRVKVSNDTVVLKNLPPSTQLAREMVNHTRDKLITFGLIRGKASSRHGSVQSFRSGESQRRLAPALKGIVEQVCISLLVQLLRGRRFRGRKGAGVKGPSTPFGRLLGLVGAGARRWKDDASSAQESEASSSQDGQGDDTSPREDGSPTSLARGDHKDPNRHVAAHMVKTLGNFTHHVVLSSVLAIINGRFCRWMPNLFVQRLGSAYLLSFLES